MEVSTNPGAIQLSARSSHPVITLQPLRAVSAKRASTQWGTIRCERFI